MSGGGKRQPGSSARVPVRVLSVVVVGCVLLGAGTIAVLHIVRAANPTQATITVSNQQCGAGWTHPHGGQQTLWVSDQTPYGAEVQLVDPMTGTVFAEIDGMGPGTTDPMRVSIGNGYFAIRCVVEDQDAVVGPTVRISGSHARSDPGSVPVTEADLIPPTLLYTRYVEAGLQVLATDTDALQAAVASGNSGAARTQWLVAHLDYERLGAAYDAFGTYDEEIDGSQAGQPLGVDDPHWEGFLRLEYALWHGQPQSTLVAIAGQLDRSVHALQAWFPTQEIQPRDLVLRTHEIMENAIQFELTDEDDEGSGTTLATAFANLQGTEELLSVLHPLLVTRDPGLAAIEGSLSLVQSDLEAAHQPDGTWTAVAALPTLQREQLDGATDQLVEELAPIADLLEPRR